jgi:hypothetical protein
MKNFKLLVIAFALIIAGNTAMAQKVGYIIAKMRVPRTCHRVEPA